MVLDKRRYIATIARMRITSPPLGSRDARFSGRAFAVHGARAATKLGTASKLGALRDAGDC